MVTWHMLRWLWDVWKMQVLYWLWCWVYIWLVLIWYNYSADHSQHLGLLMCSLVHAWHSPSSQGHAKFRNMLTGGFSWQGCSHDISSHLLLWYKVTTSFFPLSVFLHCLKIHIWFSLFWLCSSQIVINMLYGNLFLLFVTVPCLCFHLWTLFS